MNDYQQAKHLIETMVLHEQLYIKVDSIPFFRKYLRELVVKKSGNEQFTTRDEQDKGIKIIRIR